MAERKLIYADELDAEMQKAQESLESNSDHVWGLNKGHHAGLAWARRLCADAPAVDATPVVHAANVTPTHYSDEFVCGNCGFCCEITELRHEDEDGFGMGEGAAYEYECKFCPDCGAKMDGGAGNGNA